jgi:hypothetical protein
MESRWPLLPGGFLTWRRSPREAARFSTVVAAAAAAAEVSLFLFTRV